MKKLKEAYEEARRLLTENRKALDRIAGFLIQRETITGKEFMEIFHQVQNETSPASEEGLNMAFNIEEELKKLPGKPGVYLMHDARDEIIYVGKAVSLKNPGAPVFSEQPE